MKIKLTTPEQIARLRAGDILCRYPANTEKPPTDTFDDTDKTHIDTYEIKFINAFNEMISMVMTGDSLKAFSSPGDVGRLFVKPEVLMADKVWWI